MQSTGGGVNAISDRDAVGNLTGANPAMIFLQTGKFKKSWSQLCSGSLRHSSQMAKLADQRQCGVAIAK